MCGMGSPLLAMAIPHDQILVWPLQRYSFLPQRTLESSVVPAKCSCLFSTYTRQPTSLLTSPYAATEFTRAQ